MSGLFGGRPPNSMQQEVYTGVQVTTSLLGGAIPYVAGRTRIGMNLLDYGNFVVSTSNAGGGKGGGGGGTKQYSYSAYFIAGLCIGPIQGTFNIWHDRSLLNGTSSANLTYENLTLALGSSGQAIWSGYPAGTAANKKIPYDHIAYVASSAYNFGSSAAMPNLTFEVEGVVPGYSDANNIFDADPSAVIPDYLLDSVHGALGDYPGTTLTIGSPDAPLTGLTNSYQAYAMSIGALTSPYEDTQRQSTDFLSELLDCTNSNCWLACNTLKVIPYCDHAVSATVAGNAFSYTPNLTPQYIFTDDDYCPQSGDPPIKLTRAPQSDSFNMLNVEYTDRADYYNKQSVNCSDLADIAKYGPRLAPAKTWHQITQAAVAKTAGQLWLQRQLYERNTYTVRVRRNYSLLEGMDFIALNSTDPNLLLVGQLCQVTEIETQDDDKGSFLIITAREIPGVTRTTAQYNWAGAQGYFANYAADPGPVQAPMIFQMPPIPAALTDGIAVGIAVCGQTSNGAWLGADVYCSIDGGTTYQLVGTVPEAARYGQLTASLGAVADPDTTSTLSVALANTNLQLSTAVTHAEADSGQTLMMLRGAGSTTAEVIAYGAASLVSAGNYNLSYLRRGLYGSTDQAYSSGNLFVRLDGAIFQLALDPGMAGQTVYFKFVSFNQFTRYGQQTLAGATAYSYTLPVASTADNVQKLIPGGNASVNSAGTQVYKAVGTASNWDSAAYSPVGFFNGCFIAWRNPDTTNHVMAGLSKSPTSSFSYTNLDFAIYNGAGTVYVYEAGTQIASFGAYGAGDSWEVRYDGVTVRYFHNGNFIKGTRAPGLRLYPMVCLYEGGSQANNVALGPVSGVTQPGANWLNNYPWVVGTTPQATQGNYAAISAGATGSGIVLAGTGSNPLGPYGGSEPLWLAIGNGTNGADGGWNNAGDLLGIDPTKTYRSCIWFQYNFSGTLSGTFYHGCDTTGATLDLSGAADSNPYFTGQSLSSFQPGKWYLAVGIIHGSGYGTAAAGVGGIYDPVSGQQVLTATEFKMAGPETYQQQRVYLYYTTTTGVSLWLARPRFEEVNGNEISIPALLAPAVLTAHFVGFPVANVAIGLDHIQKIAGAGSYDTFAYSNIGYKTCHISGKGAVNADSWAIGFSTSPQAAGSNKFFNMNYGWQHIVTHWQIFESGVGVGSALPAPKPSDVAWVTYDGTNVSYYLNDPTTPVHQTAVSGLTLYGYVALSTVEIGAGGVSSLNFGPTTNMALVDTGQLGVNSTISLASVAQTFAGGTTFGIGNNQIVGSGVTFTVPDGATEIEITVSCDISADGGPDSSVFFFAGISGNFGLGLTQSMWQGNSNTRGMATGTVQISSGLSAGTTYTAALYCTNTPGTAGVKCYAYTLNVDVLKR